MRSIGRRFVGAMVAVAAILAAGGCAAMKSPDPRKYEGLDRKLDPFTYIEEGKIVGLAVGVQAARYREESAYLPLAVGIANKGKDTLRIDRESFLLYDDQGRRYPLAPFSEVSAKYDRATGDRQFTTFFEIFNAKFPVFTRVQMNFFPLQLARTTQDFIELAPFTYAADYLYFPRPETGVLNHRFELHVKMKPLEDPIFVKFMVD